MQFTNAVIQVFCKAPIAGSVKTRLMPELSAAQAATVHQQLTLRTLDLVTSADLCPVQLWCAPAIDHPFFVQIAENYPVTLHAQRDGDLGQRMDAALSSGLQQADCAILIGCDCPSLVTQDLIQALTALTTHAEVVIAPTEDGGYSLIGLKTPQATLFQNIQWSTTTVFEETTHKINALHLNATTLKRQWDVDTYPDYLRFLNYLNS